MTRLFVLMTATLKGIIGLLLGLLLSMPRAGSVSPSREPNAAPPTASAAPAAEAPASPPPTSINFADIAARLNPAVVNIDATARARRARRLVEEGGRRGGSVDPF